MIIRIQGEDQYRVPSTLLDELNELDNRLVLLAAQDDAAGFRQTLQEMLDLVRRQGQVLSVEELRPSDIILPSADLEFAEAKTMFVEDGLIPG
jgi:hypothetical protein